MIFILLRICKWVGIALLFSMGLAGLVLPFLNGTFFILLALILISFESPSVKRKLHSITSKNATAHKWHLYIENKLKKFLRIKD